MEKVSDAVSTGIRERFEHTKEAKKHAEESVEAGREFIEAYVEFTRYVERLYLDAGGHSSHPLPGKRQAEKHPH